MTVRVVAEPGAVAQLDGGETLTVGHWRMTTEWDARFAPRRDVDREGGGRGPGAVHEPRDLTDCVGAGEAGAVLSSSPDVLDTPRSVSSTSR